MTNETTFEQHPDLLELRSRYERAAETPSARAVEGLTLLAGLYAAISPWVVGFSGLPDLAVNDLIVGLTLAVLALGFTSAYGRTHNLAWVTPVVGAWLVVSPWVIVGSHVPAGTIVSNVIVGGLTVLLGLGMTTLGTTPVRRTTSRR